MKLQEADNWIGEVARRESQSWFKAQCRNTLEAFYLYYTTGDAKITTDSPGENWHLASAERISPAWTVDQVRMRVREILRKTPFLPAE